MGRPRPRESRLTLRQTEILRLLAQGQSNREIAAHLVLAEGTVNGHVVRIFRKLGCRNRTEAALIAHERGIV